MEMAIKTSRGRVNKRGGGMLLPTYLRNMSLINFDFVKGANRDSLLYQPRCVVSTRQASGYYHFIKAICLLLLITLAMIALPAFAQQQGPPGTGAAAAPTLSAQQMLINIAKIIPNLMQMVTAIAYVLGMYFIFHGIIKLKHAGEMRSMMSVEHSMMGPIIFLVVGALLLYLPTSVQIGISTFWSNPNPYGYVTQSDQWQQFRNIVYLVVQFVGTVSFIRGLVILSHIGGHGGGGQSNFSRGLTHIIGGILCINIYQFVQVIMVTLLGIQP